MAIYVDGKKVTGVYHGGRRLTGVYRGGRRLWGRDGAVLPVYGVEVAEPEVGEGLDLEYGLHTGDVEVEVGGRVLRLAGGGAGADVGRYGDGVLMWDGVVLTDKDVWVGAVLPVRVVVPEVVRVPDEVGYPAANVARFVFKGVRVCCDTVWEAWVRRYNNVNTDAMYVRVTVGGERVANVNGFWPEVVRYDFEKRWQYGAGSYDCGYGVRGLLKQGYEYVAGGAVDVVVEVEYKNLVAGRQHLCLMRHAAVDRVVGLRVKGLIK